jgi:phospholipase C
VKIQLDYSATTGTYAMRGFVEAYRQLIGSASVKKKAEPMAFMDGPGSVPMIDVFGGQFTVCTRWFAPLPADTQPNRLMALSGFSTVDVTIPQPLDQPTVYEWLKSHSIRWRVYRSGLPFCTLLPRLWDDILSENFRSIRRLAADVQTETAAQFPQVVFCEPAYGDSPISFGFQPNDDHPPLPVAPGQDFLRSIYQALTSNPTRWAKTVLIVTYDEHGGFYDHVEPLRIPTQPPEGVSYPPFASTGVRVPGLVVSPLVDPATVYDKPLDHTSILQFIAERFGNNEAYSPDVTARATAGIQNVSAALTRATPRQDIPKAPPQAVAVFAAAPPAPGAKTANQLAFEKAAGDFLNARRPQALQQYPELAQWEAACKHQ